MQNGVGDSYLSSSLIVGYVVRIRCKAFLPRTGSGPGLSVSIDREYAEHVEQAEHEDGGQTDRAYVL